MTFYRVYADESGETHVSEIQLPPVAERDERGVRRSLRDVPTTTLTLSQNEGPMVERGVHVPDRRQFVVVLRGTLEVITSSGERQRFGPGDGLLADDLESKGHTTRDVGEEHLNVLTVGVPPDWECPGHVSG